MENLVIFFKDFFLILLFKKGFQKISTETETVQRIESSLKQLQSSVDNLNTNSYSNDNSSKPSRQTVFVKYPLQI